MNAISSWSIRNPIPTIVLFIALTLAGLLGFTKLRLNNTPDMDIPTISVTVARPGAAPSELETQVARIVEDAVAGLGNVEHIRTTLTEGAASIMVEFAIGTNTDRATDDVSNAVAQIVASLPSDAEEPIVRRVDATDNAIVAFVVDAPGMQPDALSWFIDNDVAKAVLGAPGVSKISRAGGVDREIRIRLDPDRLMALGISATEVSQTLKTVNTDQPGGRVTLGSGEQTIRTLGSVTTIEALAATSIALSDGRTVRLSDLGRIDDSWGEVRQRARLDNREVVGFSVYRSVGSGEVAVAHAVRAKVAALQAAQPDITITEVTSSTDWVEEGYEAAVEALLIGGALAVLVVWLFLRDVRATLVSAAALPLSLIPSFGVMYLLNQSLNNITLLAIALVVGVLVDDAIVEIENIVRHMREKRRSAYDAAIEAADEIGFAVVATTFTIVAVFVPVLFMGGIPGQFFYAFAVAVCCSVLFSLLVARMLTPLMSAYLLRPPTAEVEDEPFWMPAYLAVLKRALHHRWITFCLGLCFFAASMALVPFIPTSFMPSADRGRSMLSVELAPGATLAQTDAITRQAAAILMAEPEVASVYAAIGTQVSSGPGGGGGSSGSVRKATVTVNLKPRAERALSQQAFEAEVGPKLQSLAGARVQFGADGQSGAKIQIALLSDDPAALAATVDALVRDMRTVPSLANPASSSALSQPELHIRPKPDKAAALGVTTTEIARIADIATLGRQRPESAQIQSSRPADQYSPDAGGRRPDQRQPHRQPARIDGLRRRPARLGCRPVLRGRPDADFPARPPAQRDGGSRTHRRHRQRGERERPRLAGHGQPAGHSVRTGLGRHRADAGIDLQFHPGHELRRRPRLSCAGAAVPRLLSAADDPDGPAAFVWRGAVAAAGDRQRVLHVGADRPSDADGDRGKKFDPARRIRHCGARRRWALARRGPCRCRKEARPADPDDHRRHGRGDAAHRAGPWRRRRNTRADGDRGDRRTDLLDAALPTLRAGRLHHRRRPR